MKETIRKVVLIIATLVFLSCIGYFAYNYINNNLQDKEIKQYEKTTSAITEKKDIIPIDFDGLKKKNKDIYAWIRINNTNIDYPILQPSNGDNSFYLRKDINGNYNNNGVIYTENYNNKDFNDPVTVIYGHNIWTAGKMFYQLHKFEDESFFNKVKSFTIYTPDKALKYKIYAAFEYDDRHIMKAFDFNDEKVFQEFIDYSKDPSTLIKNIRKSISVTTNDKLVVLSTCIKEDANMRYLVIGVLDNNG